MFKTLKKYMWNILAKHFAGETTEKEEHIISGWRKNPENNTIYNQIKSDLKILENMKTQFDVDSAWNKLHKRIEEEGYATTSAVQETGRHKLVRLKPNQILVRVAASVIFILAAGFILYASGVFSYLKYRTINVATLTNEEIKTIVLPDGSKVYLNSGTSFSYPRHFQNEVRQVSLSGEAFFEVEADKTNPFVIIANGALVRAVGTSFNVNARENEQHIDVFVESGSVELVEADNINNSILLESGFIGTLERNHLARTKSDDRNRIAWKTKQMVFHNTPLSEVLDILYDVFKIEIIIKEPGIDTTRIVGEYNNDPLDDILEVICTQNHLKVDKLDNKIYLSHK